MTILDCSSYASTLDTISSIHNTSIHNVQEFIYKFNNKNLDALCNQQCMSRESLLYLEWKNYFGYPVEFDETYWFHVTRLFSDNTISQHGLLPLADMENILWEKLKSLCKDSVSTSQWENFVITAKSSNRYKSKQNFTSLGPFGFLILEPIHLYKNKQLGNRDYSKGSELIDDICKGCDSDIGSLLWDLYLKETSPHIVQFRAPASNYEIPAALLYLWTKTWQPDNVGSFAINTCFDGNGVAIPAEKVLAILPFK